MQKSNVSIFEYVLIQPLQFDFNISHIVLFSQSINLSLFPAVPK